MTPEQERDLGQLMVRAQEGDRQAYEDLLTRVSGLVKGFVRRRVGDVSWTDDVVQECLVALHRARHTYDPTRPFAPWLFAIAQNRLIDALRVARRQVSRELLQPESAWPVLAERPQQERNALGADLRREVASLPEKQRLVIELLKFEELSVREVASRLNMSEANVKVTAHRGYRALRRRVEAWSRAD
jgi:RNA polymerase sigma-70 factor, ECF subfamily